MPEPLDYENREDFLDRCMGDAESNTDFPDTDQRFAFCNSQWDNRKNEKAETYTDYPKKASENAKRSLKYRDESGNPKGCGTPVGWKRANQLANREPLSEDTVKRMASFNRHRQHSNVPYDEGCGGLMWDAWGGTEGINWAIRKSKEIDDNKKNNNMKIGYSNKSTSLSVKDVDIDSRIVKGYFASFDNVDSDGDMILKGAFTKSIKEHGVESESNRKISHLAFHDVTRPVGVLKVLKEDSKGLYFESELGTHTEGEDALRMYKDGIIREHSIGFNYIKDKTKFIEVEKSEHPLVKELGGFWQIQEVKLWEGSFVTFGANSETPNLSSMKSQDDVNNELEKLKQRMEIFIKAIKDRNYSEKYNNLFEVELMQICKQYESLVKYEPFQKETPIKKSDSNNYIDLLTKIKF
jgi:HK97 family phage prohead protease